VRPVRSLPTISVGDLSSVVCCSSLKQNELEGASEAPAFDEGGEYIVTLDQDRMEAEEMQRRAREGQEEERARKEEAQRLAKAREAAVKVFLSHHGFTKGVKGPRRKLLGTTFPLHVAAEKADAKMVAMLLEAGADREQRNSDGRTAAQVAQHKGRRGSHDNVLRALSATRGGA